MEYEREAGKRKIPTSIARILRSEVVGVWWFICQVLSKFEQANLREIEQVYSIGGEQGEHALG